MLRSVSLDRYAARADQVRPFRQRDRQLLYPQVSRRLDGKLVNKTVKTYTNVSQFWTYDEKKFLEQPVYSRDFPPLKS